MNSTNFQLRGLSIANNPSTYHQIKQILEKHFKLSSFGESPFWEDFAPLDLSNYYVGGENGPKVTKGIKKLLLKHFPGLKSEILERLPAICHQIAQLYTPIMNINAYWGQKELLGSGKWELSETCFADNGCNQTSRIFLEKFNRVKVLVCEDTDRPNSSYRAIVYFGGGRNIFLTNFYAKNFPQNKGIMVEALRRILSMKKLTFSNHEFPLDIIYLNQDSIRVRSDKRVKEFVKVGKVPCPHCDEVIPYSHIFSKTSSSTILIGCSKECAETGGVTCFECGENYAEEEMTHQDGREYCQDCFDESFGYCKTCAEYYPLDQINHVRKNTYCHGCSTDCHYCGDYVLNDDILEHDGDSYCQDCFDENFSSCEECAGTYKLSELNDENLCKECDGIKKETEDETIPQNAE